MKTRGKFWIVSAHVLASWLIIPNIAWLVFVFLVWASGIRGLPLGTLLLLGEALCYALAAHISLIFLRKKALSKDWVGCSVPAITAFGILKFLAPAAYVALLVFYRGARGEQLWHELGIFSTALIPVVADIAVFSLLTVRGFRRLQKTNAVGGKIAGGREARTGGPSLSICGTNLGLHTENPKTATSGDSSRHRPPYLASTGKAAQKLAAKASERPQVVPSGNAGLQANSLKFQYVLFRRCSQACSFEARRGRVEFFSLLTGNGRGSCLNLLCRPRFPRQSRLRLRVVRETRQLAFSERWRWGTVWACLGKVCLPNREKRTGNNASWGATD